MIELVIGGARSGKSAYAENVAIQTGLSRFYIATAQAGDSEMVQRIQHHQQRRDMQWQTLEEPIYLAKTITSCMALGHCIVVDCLTLWLSNHIMADDIECWRQERQDLLGLLTAFSGHIILVGNEVGQGIVPLGEVSRRFVDESGWLHQDIAKVADKVTLVTAGLPLTLKNRNVP